ncbi:MAG TPA: hypothetical protein VGT78_05130 [Rhizomicrobium sp.]|nr:hypothetical protein [Rhizomicrobium sp.]
MAAKHIIIAAALGIAGLWPNLAGASEASELDAQAHAAIAAGNWQGAADILNKLVAVDARWTNFEALGDADFNLGKYPEAYAAFNTAIVGAKADHRLPHDQLQTALGAMYLSRGHALVQIARYDEALASYTSSATYLTNPGPAYYAIAALAYNQKLATPVDPVEYCDKAIAADPTIADAYFLKGSIQMSKPTPGPDKKMVFPPGTKEALQKYLELQPNGPEAKDAHDMLDALNQQ